MNSLKTTIKFIKTKPESKLPVRKHNEDAGMDLFTITKDFVEYGKVTAFDTGLKLADVIADPLENIMLEIKPRSGLAKNHGVIVLGGVVDSTYRGPIIVLLSSIIPGTKMEVNPGDRIAQMVIVKIENGIMARVEEAFETTETERGEKGFGSSGK
jgi:dUTP pyrophosphatase